MPRAFLIKAKKEKRKEDEQADTAVKGINEFSSGTSVPFSNGIVTKAYDGYQLSPSTHHNSSPRKRKQSQNGNERRELSVSETNAEAVKTARFNQQSDVSARKKFVADFPRMADHNAARKTRKRSPKKTVVYYYKVKREDGLEGERERKPDNRHETAPLQSVPHDGKAVSQRTGVNYANVTSQGNLAGSCYYSQHAQTKGDQENNRNQTNATGYNYGTASGMYPKERRDFPQTAPNSNNVGLDHVKIVEVHSVGKKMDIVYSDKHGNAASKAPENRPTEEYHSSSSSRSTASVPASVVPAHYIQREAPVAPEKPPVQASAPLVTPVVHYLPVYAIPSSSGVQYQAVPGAPILEKVPGSPNLFSPVQKNAPVSSQPAYHRQVPPATSQQPHAMSAPTQQQMQQPPQMHQQPAMSAPPQSSLHPLPQIPQTPSQGPVVYRPRMMADSATTPPQPPMGPSYHPQQSHAPVPTIPYHTQAQRVMQSPVLPPQSSAQPVTTLPYVVTKSESMPQQQVSSASHPVAASQPYLVPVQMVPPPRPQHYPVQSQAVPCQTSYLPQGQKVSEMASYPSPYEVRPTQQPYPVQGVPVPAPHPPLSQHAPTSQPALPAPSALIVHSTPQQSPAERSSAPLQTFYPTPNSTVHYMAEKRPPVAVHYYPAENVVTQPPQQYQEDKPASVRPLPYPTETPSQPLTPQYTPNSTEQQPKFTYAPPPPDFMYSPVYRVPTAAATEDGQPPKGAKRRKTAMPHREIRDIPTPPESYTEAPNEKCTQLQGSARVAKSPGQNPALNKSSCVITPPGSPQDDAEGTYTVVMRDYGIQAGPQTTQPSTEQGRWEIKVDSTAPRVYLSEREALADKYDHEAVVYEDDDDDDDEEEEEDEEVESDDDNDGKYSPPQKENMSPEEDFPDDDVDDLSSKQQERDMKYTCKFCHKGFQWHSHLLSHERTHTGEKPFKCPECTRAFTRADGLQCHMLVHNKKRPFKCQFCSKGFNDNTTLEKHIYSHTGVKPFKCEYCGRAFSDSQSIEKHLLVHVGTKPYKCQFCVRSFNDSQMLVRHIRSHTGEKPFKCQHCQMAFSKQSALVIHTRVHTGEKPYSCPHCSKCFSISGNLQRHILIHTGERPYQCSKCPKAFNNPSHLSRHISKLHAPQVKGDTSELSDRLSNSNLVHA